MKVSLTQFVDVVARSGLRKYGKVQQVRQQLAEEYSPSRDIYKGLREGLVKFHQQERDLMYFDQLLFSTRDTKRRALYEERIDAYKKWLGRKRPSWIMPPSGVYEGHGVDVRVNPELGLSYRGQLHIVKLYFKAEKLDPQAAQLIGALMKSALGSSHSEAVFSVLDVKHGKLREFCGEVDPKLVAVIDAELLYLARLLDADDAA